VDHGFEEWRELVSVFEYVETDPQKYVVCGSSMGI
jgi:hypothetical protein